MLEPPGLASSQLNPGSHSLLPLPLPYHFHPRGTLTPSAPGAREATQGSHGMSLLTLQHAIFILQLPQ